MPDSTHLAFHKHILLTLTYLSVDEHIDIEQNPELLLFYLSSTWLTKMSEIRVITKKHR